MPQEAQWSGTPSIRGSSESIRMFLLTFSMIGLSFTWGVELTYGTPYLLQLGLTKSRTSAVWIAGPLSGVVMQPIVGVIADNSTSKWGRRRPFMIGASLVVALCLFVLGWTSELVGIFTRDQEKRSFWTIVVAVLSIYAVDFSINVVQACSRSIIVDTLPISKQQLGSAWASRMGAVGHLVGYAIGTLKLQSFWGNLLGDTQFKQLCVLAAFTLIGTSSVTSWAVKERILLSSKDGSKASGIFSVLSRLGKEMLNLPNRIQAICWAQFWAWIGWFPFLFYSPTWVGETYFRYDNPSGLQSAKDRLAEIGRIGSMSLVIFSIITFVGSVILPYIVRSPENSKKGFTPRPPPALAATLNFINKHRPSLLISWFSSHILFAVVMMAAPFVRAVSLATIVVAASGIPWAFACWAPYAFIGVEINRLTVPDSALSNGSYRRVDTDESPPSSPTMLRLNHNLLSHDDDLESEASTGEMAGIYLGILNFYTSAPQLIGTFFSFVIFAIFEPGKSKELTGEVDDGDTSDSGKARGVNAISMCLFLGGVSSLAAAYATWRLKHVR